MSSMIDNNGVCALSLDGGYVSVLGALILLRELLHRKQRREGLLELPLPSDMFEIMAGTGMGGAMLILMGRLRLTIDLTLQYCVEISERVFGRKKWMSRDSVFSASELETVIGEIVAKHCGRADARMIEPENKVNECKVMVCARTADALRAGITTCIRTYPVSTNQGPDCTIVEAVRATTATPGIFKRAKIMEQGVVVSYVGGGLECNNPTDKLLADIPLVFPGRLIACVVSIGCGQQKSGSVPRSRLYDTFLPSKLLPLMQAVSTDCERTHQDLAYRFEHTEGVYFRFNIEHGMQGIDRYNTTKVSEVHAHAQVYMRDVRVNANMDKAAKAASLRRGLVTLQNGNIVSQKQERSGIGHCPAPSRAFTGREEILQHMRNYFFSIPPGDRCLFVLCGLGGAGKTQLALRFVQMHRHEFWDVFYIDATTCETISAGLTTLAKGANVGKSQDAGLAWLVSRKERWLLVFDNADDPKLNLHEFFPACTHGDILITTRNQQMRAHTQEPNAYCSVAGMLPEDALTLMLKASGVGGDEHEAEAEIHIAKKLIRELGHFALAIVQSGAYMRATQCGLAEYYGLFRTTRAQLLNECGTEQTDEYGLSVFASWEISRRQLSPRATQLLYMMSFMHHEGIEEAFFKAACTKAVSYKAKIPLNESQADTQSVVFDFFSVLRTLSGEWNPLALKNLTKQLRTFSLLDYDTHTCSYSMHPLIQEWCRTTAPDAVTMRECAAWVIALCVRWDFDLDSHTFRRRLLPHLLALDLNHTQIVPDVAHMLTLVYYEAGYKEEDEVLSAVALQASRDVLGNQDLITLACTHNLALAFLRQGKLEEAVTLLTEAIAVWKQVRGDEHPRTLQSMRTLAITHGQQGRLQESETLLLKVIEAQKRVIGAEHLDTLTSKGVLAWTYRGQGRLSEAEALYVKVLQTTQRMRGREHPDTLLVMHYLARTYQDQGKLREAESLITQTAALMKQVLGESHAYTRRSVWSLEDIRQRIQSELVSTHAF